MSVSLAYFDLILLIAIEFSFLVVVINSVDRCYYCCCCCSSVLNPFGFWFETVNLRINEIDRYKTRKGELNVHC